MSEMTWSVGLTPCAVSRKSAVKLRFTEGPTTCIITLHGAWLDKYCAESYAFGTDTRTMR
jgi:hypothetical protein